MGLLKKLFLQMTCITEEGDNYLYNFAKKHNIRIIKHNKKLVEDILFSPKLVYYH